MAEDEALNAMIATDLSEYFGRDRVFQLAVKDDRTRDFYTRTTVLFDDSANHEELQAQIKAGGKITVTEAPANGKKSDRRRRGGETCPCSSTLRASDLRVIAAGDHPTLGIGQELIGLVKALLPLVEVRLHLDAARLGRVGEGAVVELVLVRIAL